MSDDFLSRWSRRKREARGVPEEPAPAPASDPQPILEPEPEAELTEEEIAALPPIEELNAESDFSVFLRRGVPETLKKAALRRMWSVDPAIRDAVGHARDYAYDWNTPGGVPGNGPLAAEEAKELLRGLLGQDPAMARDGDAEPVSDPVRRGATGAVTEAHDLASEPEVGAAPEPGARDAPPQGTAGVAGGMPADEPDPPLPLRSVDPATNKTREDPPRIQRQRRHGGAKPV
jgi:hypothetical protein